MPSERNFYYDFSRELKLESWNIIGRDGITFVMEHLLSGLDGNKILLYPCRKNFDNYNPKVLKIRMDGQGLKKGAPFYIGEYFLRRGTAVALQKNSRLEVTLEYPGDDPRSELHFSLIDEECCVETASMAHLTVPYEAPAETPEAPELDVEEFEIGPGGPDAPGRFGFTKGDGLLDSAMSALGVVDKMYLCGHPRYHKPYKWSYCTLPEDDLFRGSHFPVEQSIEGDRIEVNQLSVHWRTRAGKYHTGCRYSLGSAGIVTESDAPFSRISRLEFAGNYRRALILCGGEAHSSPLEEVCWDQMSANFVLLFSTTEFPDIPLLILLARPPERVEIKRNDRSNRLSEIIFHGVSRMITSTPFGIESFDPIAHDDEAFLKRALPIVLFQSRAQLAFPVRCREFFKLDEEAGSVEIRQKFEYHTYSDAWRTPALRCAPLPPVAVLCSCAGLHGARDIDFPTKYGPLHAMVNASDSRYTIPLMPLARKFPFRTQDSATIPEEEMRSYFDFCARFPDTEQAYPYAGALLEPFAPATAMTNFMSPADRERLQRLAGERLRAVCEKDRTFDYPVIEHAYFMKTMPSPEKVIELYASPEMRRMRLWNWYDRTEPFTGARYTIGYLNVGLFSSGVIQTGTREEIAELKLPLIENDWGAGLTFYYMFLAGLAAGNFDAVRENWDLCKNVWGFFDLMHDWACMGTGYSDNAISFVEGANYGIFTAMPQMAQAAGDEAFRRKAVCVSAKQMALRLAITRASQHYFYRYYQVEPWHITKFFHNEADATVAFQNVPRLGAWPDRMREDGVYNLTTEGLYPELFEALMRYLPEDFAVIRKKLRTAMRQPAAVSDNTWGAMQQYGSLLIADALRADRSDEEFAAELANADRHDSLMRCWRGIHIFSRILPESCFKVQLLAWQAMKDHPLHLTFWENLRICDAVYGQGSAVLDFKRASSRPMKIHLGIRCRPTAIRLNGQAVSGTVRGDTLVICPETSGRLELDFPVGVDG